MLAPRKQKYRKMQKGRVSRVAKRGTKLAFGTFGLKSLGSARVSAVQIESARRAIAGSTKRVGKMWIRIFPDLPVTKKPNEVRMGKGKGSVEYFAARVSEGTVLFEIDGVSRDVAMNALELASAKMPVKTKIVELYE